MKQKTKIVTYWISMDAGMMEAYDIPKEIANSPTTRYYTNCDHNILIADNFECKVVLFYETSPGIINLHLDPGTWCPLDFPSTHDQILAGTFNFIPCMLGSLSMSMSLAAGLVANLQSYAETMPQAECRESWHKLSQEEVAQLERTDHPKSTIKSDYFLCGLTEMKDGSSLGSSLMRIGVGGPRNHLHLQIAQWSFACLRRNKRSQRSGSYSISEYQARAILTRQGVRKLAKLINEKIAL